MPGLCLSHAHGHRPLLKVPPAGDKGLNAEWLEQCKRLELELWASEVEQNAFLECVVERQNPAAPFPNHRNTFNGQ